MLRRSQRGQATVELAMAIPLIVLLTLAVVQVGVLARDRVATTHAARAAARAAAVDPSPSAVRQAAVRATGLDSERLQVLVSGGAGAGSLVTVRVRYRDPTDVALIGAVVPDLDIVERLVARVE